MTITSAHHDSRFDIATPGPYYTGRHFADMDAAVAWVESMLPLKRGWYTSVTTTLSDCSVSVRSHNSNGRVQSGAHITQRVS